MYSSTRRIYRKAVFRGKGVAFGGLLSFEGSAFLCLKPD